MDVNSYHPQSPQAFTTFRVPSGLLDVSLALVVMAMALFLMWEAATGSGHFAEVSGAVRGAAVVGMGYLAVRFARAELNHLRRRGDIGPAIERIEP